MILKSTDIRKIAHISTYTSNFSESMAKQFRNQIRFSVQCKFDRCMKSEDIYNF